MRECLILIDGLGQDAVDRYGDQFEIFSDINQVNNLSANFPSTTATSLSTLGTGVLPGVHGMLGYTVRVPRSDNRLLNALKWDERVDPVIWQKVPTLFERASQDDTYLNTLDSAGHSDGVGSDKWLTALQQVCEFITKIKSAAPNGSRIWITSDHGMVNSTAQIILGQDNNLLDNVTLIGGEPRARHIYIKPGAEKETIALWQEQLNGKAQVLSKQDAITSGLFGEVVSEDSFERMGDLIAIALDDLILIDPARVREESSMVGHHGGVTKTEVAIPLLLG